LQDTQNGKSVRYHCVVYENIYYQSSHEFNGFNEAELRGIKPKEIETIVLFPTLPSNNRRLFNQFIIVKLSTPYNANMAKQISVAKSLL
jgi:hypothetical protein